MDEREEILRENLKEYTDFAEKALDNKKYNSAVTLFFKAISAAVDLFILKKEGFVPSSHTNRFRIIEQKYTDIYNILDKDFPFYQDSYTKKMDLEAAEVLREDARKLAKLVEKGNKG